MVPLRIWVCPCNSSSARSRADLGRIKSLIKLPSQIFCLIIMGRWTDIGSKEVWEVWGRYSNTLKGVLEIDRAVGRR